MHAVPPLTAAPAVQLTHGRRTRSGFSLVEVTLAIGIISFAFVALFGLLPTGMQVFRESIDGANEMWIMQNLNSMVQVTPWDKMKDLTKYTFYFDEEGRLTDREAPDEGSTATDEVKLARLYAVKLVLGRPVRPGDGSGSSSGEVGDYSRNTLQVVAVFAPYLKKTAMDQFAQITTSDDVQTRIGRGSFLKTRAILVSRMDSIKESPTGI